VAQIVSAQNPGLDGLDESGADVAGELGEVDGGLDEQLRVGLLLAPAGPRAVGGGALGPRAPVHDDVLPSAAVAGVGGGVCSRARAPMSLVSGDGHDASWRARYGWRRRPDTSAAALAGDSCRGMAAVWSAGGAAARVATDEQKASSAAVISSMMGTMSG
jgi:hypothetical protein